MTDQLPDQPDTALGGNGLMIIVSAATIVTVALISAFLAVASWTLLPAIVLVLLLMAFGVVAAIARLIGDDDPVTTLAVERSARTHRSS